MTWRLRRFLQRFRWNRGYLRVVDDPQGGFEPIQYRACFRPGCDFRLAKSERSWSSTGADYRRGIWRLILRHHDRTAHA